MRKLYIVRMLHSGCELGSLAKAFEDAYVSAHGRKAFETRQKKIQNFWPKIEKKIRKNIPSVSDVLVYQDSTPAGEREKVKQLFEILLRDYPESKNFLLVQKLLDEGAVLEGTEDMNLVIEQMQIAQKIASLPTDDVSEILALTWEGEDLVQKRDEYIAKRIAETLPEDGTGILFIGEAHHADEELLRIAEDIEVIVLK